MTKLPKAIMAAAAGVALLGVAAGPVLAHGAAEPGGTTPHMQPAHMGQVQPAHMGQGYGGRSAVPGYGAAPCPGMRIGMGPGMMGPGSMMGPGMMGPGMMGPGMMGPGMMGRGMMDHGSMMGQGMWGGGYGHAPGQGMWDGGYGHGPGHGQSAIQADKDLSVDDVRGRLERNLKWHGNARLKVGEVKELDDDTIVAEIVTQDDSLVDRFEVDRHTGSMLRTE